MDSVSGRCSVTARGMVEGSKKERKKQGWQSHKKTNKIGFGDASKASKYYAVLVQDVVYYFKNNKKGEKNLGRMLLDRKIEIGLQDKGGKKFELTIVTGSGESVRFQASVEELKTWNTALLQSVCASLDLTGCFAPGPAGLTAITQAAERPSFPVRFNGSQITLLMCVDSQGLHKQDRKFFL
jgi:hypothetical protein